jgi:NAD(P)-dependent dehydrogenase (short-subunit alcohol dehydrogenase family)
VKRNRTLLHIATLAKEGKLLLPVLLALAAVVFGTVGWWYTEAAKELEPWVRAAKALANAMGSFFPNTKHFELGEVGNLGTQIGAALALAASTVAGVLAAAALLSNELRRLLFRWVYSDHYIVVGDSELGNRLAKALHAQGKTIVQVVRSVDDKAKGHVHFQMALPDLPLAASAVLKELRGRHAYQIIVCLSSEALRLAFARQLVALLQNQTGSIPDIVIQADDYDLAARFSDFLTQSTEPENLKKRPRFFSLNHFAARHCLHQYPLFLQAKSMGQAQVHAVIIGLGDLGERMLDQVVLTSLAAELHSPRVTVFDSKAVSVKKNFDARRPRVLEQLQISVHELDVNQHDFDPQASLQPLLACIDEYPVTAYFLCVPDPALAIRTALRLQVLHAELPRLRAPIFYRCVDDEADALAIHHTKAAQAWPVVFDHATSQASRMVRLGINDEQLVHAVNPVLNREVLAERMHNVYRASVQTASASTAPWEHLAETYRRANIRAAEHTAAKLWTVGVSEDEVRSGEPGSEPKLTPTTREHLKKLLESDERVKLLAKIEHDRWVLERKLDGWQYGPERDNTRKIHHLMLPWKEIKTLPEEVAKDRRIALETLKSVLGV